jgi:hypothetical protein
MKNVRQLIADATTEGERYYWGFVEYRGVVFPCETCHGLGTRPYPDISTWRHADLSRQIVINDVCDACWGTGDEYRHGVNLKEVWLRVAVSKEKL